MLTGAGGYIGRPVCDQLVAHGYEVHAVSRHDHKSDESVTWHTVDLLDSTATHALLADIGASHLLHLAWVTEPGAYWQSPDNALWQDASTELLKSFEAHGGERAILAGTCAEYDWTDGHCVEEKTPHRALSPYTTAKLAFRDAANALATATDLRVAWARMFFSFGPNEHPQRLMPAIIRALLSGGRAACSDGKQIRDFMYVRDMANALVAVLDSGFTGDINIASGQPTTIKDLVTLFADQLDARNRVDFGKRPRQDDEPPRITADVSRLRNTVGWESTHDIASAIDETIQFWNRSAK